jgi:hypothetical protein
MITQAKPSLGSSIYDTTMRSLWTAVETHDRDAFMALLAPDIVIRSPITQRIMFEGVDQARELFGHIFNIIRDIRMYEGVGAGSSRQVIFWRGNVNGVYLEEANLIQMNERGEISEMTVFMRAIPGLLELTANIAPALTRRHGRLRALFIRAQLALVSMVFRSAEPMVINLTKAGVPVK